MNGAGTRAHPIRNARTCLQGFIRIVPCVFEALCRAGMGLEKTPESMLWLSKVCLFEFFGVVHSRSIVSKRL